MLRPAHFVAVSLVLCALALVDCDKGTVTTPAPAQPTLISGGLLGGRACGDYTVHQTTYSFACDPLPTRITTGWQLKPLLKPPNAQGTQWTNRAIVLKVSTPSLTDLDDGNLKMTTDFRSVYATMIQEWLGFDDPEVVLKGRFDTLRAFA